MAKRVKAKPRKKKDKGTDIKRHRVARTVVIAAGVIITIIAVLWFLCLLSLEPIGIAAPWWCSPPQMGGGGNYTWPPPNATTPPTEPPHEPPPAPPPPPPELESCNVVCTDEGYDFGIASDALCKYPFSETIISEGICCCGYFEDWLNAYHITVGDEWCFDSDLNEFDHYTWPGFCVDSGGSGLWDACIEPMAASTDINEAICVGTSCDYVLSPCLIEGGTDDCFTADPFSGAFCSSL